MVTEDFSFPRVANPVAHFSLSPSLWRVSSLVYPDCDDQEEGDDEDASGESFYSIEIETKNNATVGGEAEGEKSHPCHVERDIAGMGLDGSGLHTESERMREMEFDSPGFHLEREKMKREVGFHGAGVEKMDKLWEEFNEELKRVDSVGEKVCGFEVLGSEKMEEVCYQKGLKKMNKTSNGVLSLQKIRGMMVLSRFLKKFFLLRNSARLRINR